MKNLTLNFALRLILLIVLTQYTQVTFAGYESETIQQAYNFMVKTNPTFLESVANKRASLEAYNKARGGYFPVLYVEYNVGRGKGQNFSPQTLSLPFTTNNFQHKKIGIRQYVFDGGALYYKVQSAQEEYQSAFFQSLAEKNQVALRAASAYLAILRAQEMKEVASDNLSKHQKTLQFTKLRYEGGRGTVGEYTLLKSRVDDAVLALSRTKLDYEKAKAIYREVIGHSAPRHLHVPSEPKFMMPATYKEAQNVAITHNPSLTAECHILRSANDAIYVEKANVYFPKVNLEINTARDTNIYGVPGRLTYSQGYLTATYNIINGGADIAAERQAAEKYIASKERLEAKRREIISTVDQTWDELTITKQDYPTLKNRRLKTRQLVTLYEKEFMLAKRTLFDVVNTQAELLNEEFAFIDAKYKILIDSYALLASSGKLASYFASNANGKAHA